MAATPASQYAAARQAVLGMLPKGGTGAEIGVWTGDFSAGILSTAQPVRLYLIDPWQAVSDPAHEKALYSTARGADMDAIHASVCQRFAGQIADGQVVVHRAPSAQAMTGLADGSLDFIYIDGDHRYAAVRADLDLAWQKCRRGGLIVVDDYSSGKWWGDDIVRATNEFIGRHGAALAIIFALAGQVAMVKR